MKALAHHPWIFRPGIETLEERVAMAADTVIDWNNVLLDAIRVEKTAPPRAARAMAIVHAAIYDSVNAIDRTHEAYLVDALVHPRASKEAAVAAAARDTLAALFPAQTATFDVKYTSSLAAIADGKPEDDGVALGHFVAAEILAIRAGDGSAVALPPYLGGTAPGEWRPTPPGFAPGSLPQWPNVTPFAIPSGDAYRPDAPPALGSAEYTAAFEQVKNLGSATSTTRTAEQSAIARFWANGAGTSTPAGHWNIVAQIASEQHGNSLVENARLFAVLNIALADAAIVSWDAKYEYNFWRPVTAIREAADDGNPNTVADAAWSSYIVTPAFPAYTSGHSTFSAAGATVLARFFGSDSMSFTLPSEDPMSADRHFTSFWQAAEESGMSRIYGGIHWNFDNAQGLATGKKVGQYVFKNVLESVKPQPRAGLINGELIVSGSDRHDLIRVDFARGLLVVTANGKKLGLFAAAAAHCIVVDARAGDDIVLISEHVRIHCDLYGGAGNDLLKSGRGNDRLWGETGRDLLFGCIGNDQLHGGPGLDQLFGGEGQNWFDDGIVWNELRTGGGKARKGG